MPHKHNAGMCANTALSLLYSCIISTHMSHIYTPHKHNAGMCANTGHSPLYPCTHINTQIPYTHAAQTQRQDVRKYCALSAVLMYPYPHPYPIHTCQTNTKPGRAQMWGFLCCNYVPISTHTSHLHMPNKHKAGMCANVGPSLLYVCTHTNTHVYTCHAIALPGRAQMLGALYFSLYPYTLYF